METRNCSLPTMLGQCSTEGNVITSKFSKCKGDYETYDTDGMVSDAECMGDELDGVH